VISGTLAPLQLPDIKACVNEEETLSSIIGLQIVQRIDVLPEN